MSFATGVDVDPRTSCTRRALQRDMRVPVTTRATPERRDTQPRARTLHAVLRDLLESGLHVVNAALR